MRVRCHKLINPITDSEEEMSPWLTIGETYLVLSVYAFENGDLKFRIIGDSPYVPILVNARQFVTTSSDIPSNWLGVISADGTFQLTPQSWLRRGFWEHYFNNEPGSIEEFKQESQRIQNEEPNPFSGMIS